MAVRPSFSAPPTSRLPNTTWRSPLISFFPAGLTDGSGKFSLTLFSRLSRPIEDISISIYLGAGAASVSATATGDKRFVSSSAGGAGGVAALGGIGGMGAKEEAPKGGEGGGTWEFDPHTQVMRWKLGSLVQNERPPTLTGSFVST